MIILIYHHHNHCIPLSVCVTYCRWNLRQAEVVWVDVPCLAGSMSVICWSNIKVVNCGYLFSHLNHWMRPPGWSIIDGRVTHTHRSTNKIITTKGTTKTKMCQKNRNQSSKKLNKVEKTKYKLMNKRNQKHTRARHVETLENSGWQHRKGIPRQGNRETGRTQTIYTGTLTRGSRTGEISEEGKGQVR